MIFNDELEFEEALVNSLKTKGWNNDVIKYPTEKDLIENWKKILFNNNRQRERLGDYPLTDTEFEQIMEQITNKPPFQLNKFINGGFITIKRDNPNDKENKGKEISLKIYNRQEIAARSKYISNCGATKI